MRKNLCDEAFEHIDAVALTNQRKVLQAFKNNRLSEEHFAEQTGYGLHDGGREIIDKIYAEVMQAEKAAVRLQFVSGTHAIACALFGNLKAGQRMVSLTGRPYDTLHPVIGLKGSNPQSLIASGVLYEEFDFSDLLALVGGAVFSDSAGSASRPYKTRFSARTANSISPYPKITWLFDNTSCSY